jgi:hypothetical protein
MNAKVIGLSYEEILENFNCPSLLEEFKNYIERYSRSQARFLLVEGTEWKVKRLFNINYTRGIKSLVLALNSAKKEGFNKVTVRYSPFSQEEILRDIESIDRDLEGKIIRFLIDDRNEHLFN